MSFGDVLFFLFYIFISYKLAKIYHLGYDQIDEFHGAVLSPTLDELSMAVAGIYINKQREKNHSVSC